MSLKTKPSTSSSFYNEPTQIQSSQEHIMMQDQPTSSDQKLTNRTLSWKQSLTTEQDAAGNPSTADQQMNGDGLDTVPEKKKKHNWKEPTAMEGLMAIIKSSWLNVLVIFIPIGIASHFTSWPATVPFIINFIAIIPLAKLLGFATEDLSLRVGEVCVFSNRRSKFASISLTGFSLLTGSWWSIECYLWKVRNPTNYNLSTLCAFIDFFLQCCRIDCLHSCSY